MDPTDTIKLLIIHDSTDEAERIINLMRGAGKPILPQHVQTEYDFMEAADNRPLDLILAQTESEDLPPDTVISYIKQIDKDIPVIILQEDVQTPDIVEGLRLGAKDVISENEDLHILLVIQRELDNLYNRRVKILADRALRESEHRCQLLLDSSRDAIAYIHDGMHTYANQTYVDLFGYGDADEISCLSIIDLVAKNDLDAFKKFIKDHNTRDDYGSAESTFTAQKSNGDTFQANMVLSPAIFDDEISTQIMIHREASSSASVQITKAIETISSQDLLTGLSNRPHFISKIESAVDDARKIGQDAALIYITIDNINIIKNKHSIAAADLLLSDIALLLRRKVEEETPLARFSEDVFTVLLADPTPEYALEFADSIVEIIENNISETEKTTLQATCSIGICLINNNSESSDLIIARCLESANIARAMNASSGCVHLYKDKTPATNKLAANMATRLESALNDGRFKLLFQPIISLRGSGNEYYEVLLRLIDESGSEISPHHFLEQAEQLEVTNKLDRWVILQSLKILADHLAKGNDTRLIINLTSCSIRDKTLVPWLNVAFKAAGIPPHLAIFQFNENHAANFLNDAKAFSQAISELGCKCVLSQFGCALKPLNILKHLDVEYIKIDGSYTRDIQNKDEDPKALVALIKELHARNKQTIVPFVENAKILSTLWQAGAHYIQGHYLQAPSGTMDYDFDNDD